MPSFQLAISPSRKAAARFIGKVKNSLLSALDQEPHVRKSDIAREIGVHRSVITRQLGGYEDMSLGRVAEIAWALGREIEFSLVRDSESLGNVAALRPISTETSGGASTLEIPISENTHGHTFSEVK